MHQRCRGGVDGQDVVGVLHVDAEDGGDDVDLVAEAVGEGGAQGAVDQAAGKDGLLGRLALTAEERAGDLAGGVHPLFDVDGEGEEVDAFPDAPGGGGGDEHDGVAHATMTAPSASPAELAGLESRVLSVPLMGPERKQLSCNSTLVLHSPVLQSPIVTSDSRAGRIPDS